MSRPCPERLLIVLLAALLGAHACARRGAVPFAEDSGPAKGPARAVMGGGGGGGPAPGGVGAAGSVAGTGAAGGAEMDAAAVAVAGDGAAADSRTADVGADVARVDAGGGPGGEAGVLVPPDLMKVKPSAGCGKEPNQVNGAFVKHTVQTSGTKDANCLDSKCGPWSYLREYHVWLPPNYDKTRAYPLAIQAGGCGSDGTSGLFSLSPTNMPDEAGVGGTVIRVGLTPPPSSIGHGTNPNQGCFDDREGDDSVELPFYEAVIDRMKADFCYDENRVFVTGNSSGAWLANQLSCKYAGDTRGYAIRGVAGTSGGFFSAPGQNTTCSGFPAAGIWVYLSEEVFIGTLQPKAMVLHALSLNHCGEPSFEAALKEPYPIGGGLDDKTCLKFTRCPTEYPVILCTVLTRSAAFAVSNVGFATFLRSMAAR